MVPFLEDRKCQVPSCLDYYYMFGLLLRPGITTSSLDYDSISGLLVHLWITTSSFNYRFIFIFYLWINTPSLDYIYILGLPLYVWIIAIPLDNKSCRVPQFVLFLSVHYSFSRALSSSLHHFIFVKQSHASGLSVRSSDCVAHALLCTYPCLFSALHLFYPHLTI